MSIPAHPVPTPTQPYLRRAAVLEWLEACGIEAKDFAKLVKAGTIERIVLHAGGRGYYLRAAIEQHLIAPFRAAEARLKGEI